MAVHADACLPQSQLTLAIALPPRHTCRHCLREGALFAIAIAAHFLFPVPLTADVIDHDSARTKLRREAMYLGASSFAERTATSLAFLLLALLRLLGDTRGHTLGVRLVGPAAGLVVLAGYVLFRHYHVPDNVLDRVEPQAATPRPQPPEPGAPKLTLTP